MLARRTCFHPPPFPVWNYTQPEHNGGLMLLDASDFEDLDREDLDLEDLAPWLVDAALISPAVRAELEETVDLALRWLAEAQALGVVRIRAVCGSLVIEVLDRVVVH